ncbi:MAG: 30S ribosomal protein S12 methylthiotransferase RimO [Oscillospiraceae bacterium]|nr:30S ribosomal protein S12 methylthiotransferase RimO [Oscillospiraceae bacterium]
MTKQTLALISLGCAKNLVNSEQMLCLLDDAGYPLIGDPAQADGVIINTCGFIDDAKSEAIDTILEMAALRQEGGKPEKIIVTGCLSERYRAEIKAELPEVDALVGVGSFGEIVNVVEETFAAGKAERFGDKNAPVDEVGRYLTTGPGWAYLKIAEGCSNCCSFCAIPSIRGRYRSRPMENVLAEARDLAAAGVKELIVIAQDITRYGTDLYGKPSLAELCRRLSEIEGVQWLRLHYLYPDAFDEELIGEIASNEKIVKYLDIPIQHVNDTVLKRMNRRGTGDEIRALLRTLRARIPDLVLRTSLITGFPGETEAQFDELCAFLRETRIERVGVFPFSPEEGTFAAQLDGRVDEDVARRRADFIMELQEGVMEDWYAAQIGKTLTVLCTGAKGGYLTGRSWADSPEVDGTVWFEGDCAPGLFCKVKITGLLDGELCGEEVEA